MITVLCPLLHGHILVKLQISWSTTLSLQLSKLTNAVRFRLGGPDWQLSNSWTYAGSRNGTGSPEKSSPIKKVASSVLPPEVLGATFFEGEPWADRMLVWLLRSEEPSSVCLKQTWELVKVGVAAGLDTGGQGFNLIFFQQLSLRKFIVVNIEVRTRCGFEVDKKNADDKITWFYTISHTWYTMSRPQLVNIEVRTRCGCELDFTDM